MISGLDLTAALRTELTSHTRLLPKRLDYALLKKRQDQLRRWIEAQTKLAHWGGPADIVQAEKVHGTRPLAVMTIEDRTVYRALVDRLAQQLPDDLRHRQSNADFQRAPLDQTPAATYITVTDIASYYVYVDHDVLVDELTSQTGDYDAVEATGTLLDKVMGRGIGIPQVSTASDVLGDTYLDRARRNLIRRGLSVFRYADDFRLTASSLLDARRDLDVCGAEVYRLGLMLNDTKTFTNRRETYEANLSKFRDAEKRLFETAVDDEEEAAEDGVRLFGLSLLVDSYSDELESGDDDDEGQDEDNEEEADGPQPDSDSKDASEEQDSSEAATLSDSPLGDVDEDETITDSDQAVEADKARASAAAKAWSLWLERHTPSLDPWSFPPRVPEDDAVVRSLLGYALPILGSAGNTEVLDSLKRILDIEPSLTPQLCVYLENLPSTTERREAGLRELDALLESPVALSDWQRLWLAHALGAYAAPEEAKDHHSQRPHIVWLSQQLRSDQSGVAATALATLGRLGCRAAADEDLVRVVERVTAPWRTLALFGLALLNRGLASQCTVDRLDTILLEAMADESS
ncbi:MULTISPECIES: RNA-directed DNA polymerase [Mycobacterium]|uniref:RNA-directed DNA polymerase n=1 Tax=Mycobacterium TaxID=1763 RepID=UPI0004475776|nr:MULTISPECIES: RNA-directed DNA polymerase [Mycobacterium]EUA26654.1 reverse transcriptase family protein [Mycobacterium intracellulare]MCA2252108.1 RNA-directed DNA polymerase [Mycobacterium intracellulare]MCA2302920.1 RNA-directed DNA polymerase [Mycobacterium intracellulare]MCA2345488.1 RNA-directed DNA polymerase [Mycobacterium intracellulare]UGU02990.1 RNA-directed DNA polymerase [Mycobacterium intracellulare]